jgi:hypothetical protein
MFWRSSAVRDALDSKQAHYVSLAVVILAIVVNQVGLLVSLFSCEQGISKEAGVEAATEAIRWILVSLTVIMLLELAVRAVSLGPVRYFSSLFHVLDAVVLVVVLLADCIVSETTLQDAIYLLLFLRLVRFAKLMTEVGSVDEEARADDIEERAALKRRVLELEQMVGADEMKEDVGSHSG